MGGYLPRVRCRPPRLYFLSTLPAHILIMCTHRSGVIALADLSQTAGAHFVASAHINCLKMGIDAKLLSDRQSIKDRFGPTVPTGTFGTRTGYANPIGGWAEAARAVEVGIKRIRLGGGVVRGGAEVVGLITGDGGRGVEGVVLKDGEEVRGDLVVVSGRDFHSIHTNLCLSVLLELGEADLDNAISANCGPFD
jgi:hypothetical protein